LADTLTSGTLVGKLSKLSIAPLSILCFISLPVRGLKPCRIPAV
jgi:hypothetical protein